MIKFLMFFCLFFHKFFYLSSGNVLFADNRAAATALEGLTVALILHKSQDTLEGVPEEVEVIDANDIEYSVPPNRWRLGKSHDKAKHLLLRFASTSLLFPFLNLSLILLYKKKNSD